VYAPASVMRRYTTPENWMLFMSAGTMAMPTPAATRPMIVEDSSTSRTTRGRNPAVVHKSITCQ